MRSVIPAIGLVFMLVVPAWSSVQEGLAAERRGDLKTAFLELSTPAQAGDAVALYYLGLMYEREGEAFWERSPKWRWSQWPAEIFRCPPLNLSVQPLHERGHEPPFAAAPKGKPNFDLEALSCLQSSAEKGYMHAQYLVGLRYEQGVRLRGAPVGGDVDSAIKWYELAATQGHDIAAYRLWSLTNRRTMTPNGALSDWGARKVKSIFYGEVRDNSWANPEQVARLLQIPDDASPEDLYQSGLRHYQSTGAPRVSGWSSWDDVSVEHVMSKDTKAAAYVWRCAKLGHVPCESVIGIMYYKGLGVKQDTERALYWLREAASAKPGDREAQYQLSVYHWEGDVFRLGRGDVVPRDPQNVFFWATKSADQGHEGAKAIVGLAFELGYGVARDRRQAIFWLQKAGDRVLAGMTAQRITHDLSDRAAPVRFQDIEALKTFDGQLLDREQEQQRIEAQRRAAEAAARERARGCLVPPPQYTNSNYASGFCSVHPGCQWIESYRSPYPLPGGTLHESWQRCPSR